MKISPFKVGDKVILKAGGKTLDCVAAVRYRFVHQGDPGAQICYLDLVGKDSPAECEDGWPSAYFRLMWSGDKAAR